MKRGRLCILPLALRFGAFFLLALACYLLRPVPALHALLLWGALPLAGAWLACAFVTRGLNAYLAWLPPPITQTAAGFIASMGYAPGAGAVLVCALAALIGAACGEVIARNARKGKGRG